MSRLLMLYCMLLEASSGCQGVYFPWRRWTVSGMQGRQPLCPFFQGTGLLKFYWHKWLIIQTVFHYRLHHSVKSTLVNYYMVIIWYSSYTSCSKIFILTKFSEYNLRANRYNTSCGKEETQYKSSHGQPVFTVWRVQRHENLAFTNLVFRLGLIFKALWQGDSVRKYKPT